MDDLYPNDGSFFQIGEPEEQAKEKKSEKAETAVGIRMIERIIKRLQERINFYSSIDSIDVDLTESPEVHQKEVAAKKLVKFELELEKSYWVGLLDK